VAGGSPTFECVINVSEGRDRAAIDLIASAAGEVLLDVHTDPEHHRSVLTLGGRLPPVEEAARSVAAAAVSAIDLRDHRGVHPRFGAVDVVPFVPLPTGGSPDDDPRLTAAIGARDRFAAWAADHLGVPCFLYGPGRSLPEIRRRAFRSIPPDTGPPRPHPSAGATAVGARGVLVAYNVWIAAGPEGREAGAGARALAVARDLAAALRSPSVRALGLPVEAGAQVSVNLVAPTGSAVADVYDAVAAGAEARNCRVLRAELVGLIPVGVLEAVPPHRWSELDLDADRTIEGRLRRGSPAT
jgi:glutamate formiminotransferase